MRSPTLALALVACLLAASASATHVCNSGWTRFWPADADQATFDDDDANETFARTMKAGVADQGCALQHALKTAACFDPQFNRAWNHVVGQWGFDAQLVVTCPGTTGTQRWTVTATSVVAHNGKFWVADFDVQPTAEAELEAETEGTQA